MKLAFITLSALAAVAVATAVEDVADGQLTSLACIPAGRKFPYSW